MSKFGQRSTPETNQQKVETHKETTESNSFASDNSKFKNPTIQNFLKQLQTALIQQIDSTSAIKMAPEVLRQHIEQFVNYYAAEKKMQFSIKEQKYIAGEILSDMIGLGPLEALFLDESVSDIMVNGPNQIYVESKGKLVLTNLQFREESHLQQIAQRIANWVGRRVDSSSPLCDARLADGSRVNIVIPPIALDGTSISIRKFPKNRVTFDQMLKNKTITPELAEFLQIASKIGLNMIVAGGTGSGKTTLLNALSSLIDPGERIVTCEDAAELLLQQPHVVRLESRPPNIEGGGEITIRDLVKNALRMRPDRIVIGEVRGAECIDMLQAMNTGHDGSMSTVHANSAREAITRLENMVAMSGFDFNETVIRNQIAGAVNLIVQTDRMQDGVRRIVEVVEITGVENKQIMHQQLFKFVHKGMDENGKFLGAHESNKLVPKCLEKAAVFNLDKRVLELLGISTPEDNKEEK